LPLRPFVDPIPVTKSQPLIALNVPAVPEVTSKKLLELIDAPPFVTEL
jgi:hypothetical protein